MCVQTHEVKISGVGALGAAGVSHPLHLSTMQEGVSTQGAQLEPTEGIVSPLQEEAEDGGQGEQWDPRPWPVTWAVTMGWVVLVN